jgi:hypothetical protein
MKEGTDLERRMRRPAGSMGSTRERICKTNRGAMDRFYSHSREAESKLEGKKNAKLGECEHRGLATIERTSVSASRSFVRHLKT